MALPLVVFDTNIILDVWLGRDRDDAVLLVRLAEIGRIELVIPEYVLIEFRGTALRWVRDETSRLHAIRSAASEWGRAQTLGAHADELRLTAKNIETTLASLGSQVDNVCRRMTSVARVPTHTNDVHLRGDLRYLSGRPPDRPVDGLKDCRIYEAVLEIARADRATARPKFLVTRDSDFDAAELTSELASLGFELRKEPGRLYGELR